MSTFAFIKKLLGFQDSLKKKFGAPDFTNRIDVAKEWTVEKNSSSLKKYSWTPKKNALIFCVVGVNSSNGYSSSAISLSGGPGYILQHDFGNASTYPEGTYNTNPLFIPAGTKIYITVYGQNTAPSISAYAFYEQ